MQRYLPENLTFLDEIDHRILPLADGTTTSTVPRQTAHRLIPISPFIKLVSPRSLLLLIAYATIRS